MLVLFRSKLRFGRAVIALKGTSSVRESRAGRRLISGIIPRFPQGHYDPHPVLRQSDRPIVLRCPSQLMGTKRTNLMALRYVGN